MAPEGDLAEVAPPGRFVQPGKCLFVVVESEPVRATATGTSEIRRWRPDPRGQLQRERQMKFACFSPFRLLKERTGQAESKAYGRIPWEVSQKFL
jgi:hypothetical protein